MPPERLHQLVAELERVIAAELTHPVIAAPMATGTDGVATYLAHDYVPADSLDVVLRDEGSPAPAGALRVAAQLAGALDFAAAANVHHGVLHPRDVLISQNDTRLTGLGVAGAIEKVGVTAPRRRPYAAPERVAGHAWDRRADVFSLAALIHEMLWGRRLTAIGAEAADALTDLPGADLGRLKAAFARALALDPADRFEAASDFATALEGAFPDVTIEPDLVRSVRLPPSPEASAFADASADRRSFSGGWAADRRSLGGGLTLPPVVEDDLRAVPEPARLATDDQRLTTESFPEPDDLELRAAEDARYDQVEFASSIAWEPAAETVDPVTGPAGLGIATPQEVPLTGPQSPLFQSNQIDFRERLDVRDEPRDPGRSVTRRVAAALIVGLLIGFAGGYGLGGRRGTPAVALAPAAAAPLTDAAVLRGREFTEAAVSDADTIRLKPVPSARPSAFAEATADRRSAKRGGWSTLPRPTRGQAGSGQAVEGPDATATPAASATGPGRLLVRSTPAGARVFVDGREHGQTPATIRDLTRGTHRVRLVRDGYVAEERRVAITAAQSSPSMTVDLKRAGVAAARPAGSAVPPAPATIGASVGSLTVDSRPAGASVFIDGKLVGTTPLSLPQLAAGEHAVRMERDGYRRWSSSVHVTGGQSPRVTASLER